MPGALQKSFHHLHVWQTWTPILGHKHNTLIFNSLLNIKIGFFPKKPILFPKYGIQLSEVNHKTGAFTGRRRDNAAK
jgi:hypothetical protein